MSKPALHIAATPPDRRERLPTRDAGIPMAAPAILRTALNRFLNHSPNNFPSDSIGRCLTVIKRATALTGHTGPSADFSVLKSPSLYWSVLMFRILMVAKSSWLRSLPIRMSDVRRFSNSPLGEGKRSLPRSPRRAPFEIHLLGRPEDSCHATILSCPS